MPPFSQGQPEIDQELLCDRGVPAPKRRRTLPGDHPHQAARHRTRPEPRAATLAAVHPRRATGRLRRRARAPDAAARTGHRRPQPLPRATRPRRPCRRAHRPGPGRYATIGLLHERNLRRTEILGEQLQAALNSRITIEQAKDAECLGVDMDTAFIALRHYARDHNLRLSDLSQAFVDNGPAAFPDLIPLAPGSTANRTPPMITPCARCGSTICAPHSGCRPGNRNNL